MTDRPNPGGTDVREALEELQAYLSDSIPPLFFYNSVKSLLEAAPELVAAQILAWSTTQQALGGSLPTADYIFHAAKKIHMLAELELLPEEVVKAFLVRIRSALLEGCPAPDRESLLTDLNRLDLEVTLASPGGVDVVYRRAASEKDRDAALRPRGREATPGGEEIEDISRSVGARLRKLDQQLRRLEVQAPAAATGAGPAAPSGLAAELLTEATVGAESDEDLEEVLGELKQRGLPASTYGLMRVLANNLPDWAPPPIEVAGPSEAPQAAVRAMHRFISLAKDQQETQRRFDELVDTAVEEFNKGSLGRAVTLLDLAASMVSKKEVEAVFAQSVQRRARGRIAREKLRESADSEEKHHLLRRFLVFFEELSPAQLLIELEAEESRDRRRLLMDLLTVHGPEARRGVCNDLTQAVTGAATFPWYYLRNLVHLLRSIPRQADESVDIEIDLLVPMSELQGEFPLVREALTALGQLWHTRVATVLAARLSEIEDALLGDRQLPHRPDQLRFLLDSTARSLVRMSVPEARRSLVAHGLKRKSELGDTLERLGWLSGQDFSGEPDLVDRLVREIHSELPKRVLGLTLAAGRKKHAVEVLVQVLSGTDTPAVREALRKVSEGFSGQPFADAAGRALRGLESPVETKEPAADTLSGDLELFGLPNLLQNLSDSQIGGVLTLFDRSGASAAKVWLKKGKIVAGQAGKLTGETAVYHLLEDPAPGRFVLGQGESPPEAARIEGGEPISIHSLLFEGIRRYDEFKRAAAMAPDESRFRSTGRKPTLAEGETNAELFKEVWRRAASGCTPAEAEAELPVDRFRVRRLFEHWISEEALELAESAPTNESEP